MNDREFLVWLHKRLQNFHSEDPRVGFMRKLQAVISATPPDRDTPIETPEEQSWKQQGSKL